MAEQSKLIIHGDDARKALYCGDGTKEQWKEKLGGKLTDQCYYITQIQISSGPTIDLQTTMQGFVRNPTDGQYYSVGVNETLYPLNRESKNLLLDLINSVPEQTGR